MSATGGDCVAKVVLHPDQKILRPQVWRQYGAHVDLIPQFAADLVKAKVDVIVATGDTAIRAVQRATTTIPILGSTDDMVGSGLVNSMARPDGNTTGTSIFAAELDGKRQEILIEAVPGLRHIAALVDSEYNRIHRASVTAGWGASARR